MLLCTKERAVLMEPKADEKIVRESCSVLTVCIIIRHPHTYTHKKTQLCAHHGKREDNI